MKTVLLLSLLLLIPALNACGFLDVGEGEREPAEGEGEGEREPAEGEGEAPLTGDVWVDAADVVVGAYRAFSDIRDDSLEALVGRDNVVWRVVDNTDVVAVDAVSLLQYFESDDCTGEGFIARGSFVGNLRVNVTLRQETGGGGLSFVPGLTVILRPGSTPVRRDCASAIDGGCFTKDQFLSSFPVEFYAGDDFDVATAPAFTPPLRIERH